MSNRMGKTWFAVVSLLCLCGAELSHAQRLKYDTVIARQEAPLPPNDSGGRWLSSAIIVTSTSAYPTHIQVNSSMTYSDYGLYALDTAWRLADSAYYQADSIIGYQKDWPHSKIVSTMPWKYIDTTFEYQATLDFLLPAHGTLRIPIKMQAIKQGVGAGDTGRVGDTVSHIMSINAYVDSAGTNRYGYGEVNVRCITMYSNPCGGYQESIPANDSGGRWLHSAMILKSSVPYAMRLSVPLTKYQYSSTFGSDTSWKLDDSALYIADSIFVTMNTFNHYASNNPRTYVDTIHGKTSYAFDANLSFSLPAYGTIRIPILIRTVYNVENRPHQDTLYSSFGIGYQNNKGVWYSDYITYGSQGACSGPYIAFDGQPLSNKDDFAIIGQSAAMKGSCLNGVHFPLTHATYKMIGEFADRYTFPDSVFSNWAFDYPLTTSLLFNGAPKAIIHDTLISTFTSCWGSITTRSPITAYSAYSDGYKIRTLHPKLIAPFLGAVDGDAAVITNLSDFPITVRNLRPTYDSLDFEATAPSLIAPHDSGYIHVTLRDRDVYRDTLDPDHSTTFTGIIAPYQQELGFKDSIFSFTVEGAIDVYSPNYFSLIPKLQHGIHPAGIIFTSSVSSLSGPGTFLTVYGNDDPTTRYFGLPYYDDPHFSIAIGNYVGAGAVLPGEVPPHVGMTDGGIQALTTFTGDSYHNYLTQLHWPRDIDTITIDVLAIGKSAPRFLRVREEAASRLVVWPNPASQLLHLELPMDKSDVVILDALGRTVLKQRVESSASTLDISSLPPGVYRVCIPNMQSSMLEVVR
jgi:hypothetical protein